IENRHDFAADRLSENSLPLQQRRNCRCPHGTERLLCSLVIDKEEGAVFEDRPAQRRAVLVATELRLVLVCWSEIIFSIQGFVAQKFEDTAVEGSRATAAAEVYYSPVEAPELCGDVVALNVEFLNSINDGKKCNLARLGLQGADAIEEVFVRAGTAAVDSRKERAGWKSHPRSQRRELNERTAVQWD